MHSLNTERDGKSEFLLAEEILSSGDDEKCHEYLRMKSTEFDFLLKLLEPCIKKKDTFWRLAVPAKQRLILTIR